ncbi:MAG: NAD-dependent protein deacylase [Bacilli bacterium]|nr:NAD-dependent protein deacylase [Bacilli bacterium]
MTKVEKLQEMIDASENIVFFGGAGVSTDSGIKDFRSPDGLYNMQWKYPPELMLSARMFYKETADFYSFYKANLNSLTIEPNVTHYYLSKLEERGKLRAIVTQNIDGLHKKAGSKTVYEIHGTIYENHCLDCGKFYDASFIFESENVPTCDCGGIVKPDVVLYGEMLMDNYELAQLAISQADMLIVAGTSLTVMPAADLVRLFHGKYLVILNRESTSYDNKANLVIHDNLKSIFEQLR